jgi:hypothetical protein
VERIVAEKQVKLCKANTRTSKFYLVHWLGYSDAQNTWEPEANISDDVSEIEFAHKNVLPNASYPVAHCRLETKSEAQPNRFPVIRRNHGHRNAAEHFPHIHCLVNQK